MASSQVCALLVDLTKDKLLLLAKFCKSNGIQLDIPYDGQYPNGLIPDNNSDTAWQHMVDLASKGEFSVGLADGLNLQYFLTEIREEPDKFSRVTPEIIEFLVENYESKGITEAHRAKDIILKNLVSSNLKSGERRCSSASDSSSDY